MTATGALWVMTLVPAALVVAVPGAPAAVRDVLAFRLEEGQRSGVHEAVTYLTTNARVVAVILVCAWARSRTCAGPLLDVVVAAIIGANVGLVGIALGAYGFSAVPWLVHLPVEWAALGVASAAYAAGRAHSLSTAEIAGPAGAAALLLAAAAMMEAWATP